MIELTPEQCQILQSEEPAQAINPQTQERFVLVKVDVYERLKGLMADDESWVEASYMAAMEVMGSEGWNDPCMDIYDDLDPRRTK